MGGSKASSPSNASSPKSSGSLKNRPKVTVNAAQFKRRLDNELRFIKAHSKEASSLYKLLQAEDRRWTIRFSPTTLPYNNGSYRMVVDFPQEYPFKPPSMTFLTKIYHPCVGEKGNVELGVCHPDAWKPTVRMSHLCDYIVLMLNYPQPSMALRKEVGEQMLKNRDTFIKEAITISKNHAEPRT